MSATLPPAPNTPVRPPSRRPLVRIAASVLLAAATLSVLPFRSTRAQAPAQFGGEYAGLDDRRRALVDDWVSRLNKVTGQEVPPARFYDEFVRFSVKTTFDAVTHALMTTPLTGAPGGPAGDALDLIERLDAVNGQVVGARGDRQFRMYVRLREHALERLAQSQEFRRGADNTVYHRGYPINYRQQGGVPSIQFSVARDGRHADIDVDYRAASFPAALFNGHLTSSNSDVRAGNNHTRHTSRWTGFRDWWRSFFGIRLDRDPAVVTEERATAAEPRAGRKTIDVMVHDFLTAWLIEGDVLAARPYISERAYACLALEAEDPSSFDRGMAPFALMAALRAAKETIGPRTSLDGLTFGVRLADPVLKVVRQPHHARFVIYAVPDDVAAKFDCESRLTLGSTRSGRGRYGNYFGAVFAIEGNRTHTVALLWARQNGYWKIVSWRAEPDGVEQAELEPAPDVEVKTIDADETLVNAARTFLESWLVKKDYERAFEFLSPASYDCYNLTRSPGAPDAASRDEAGRLLRTALERSGAAVGRVRRLEDVVEAAVPLHPSTLLLRHAHDGVFALSSVPDALAAAAACSTRGRDAVLPDSIAPEYHGDYGMTVRLVTRDGDAPVLRLLWKREKDAWRITAYGVELP